MTPTSPFDGRIMPKIRDDRPERPSDSNQIVGLSLIGLGVLLLGYRLHQDYPAEVEIVLAVGAALASIWALASTAVDRLRQRSVNLIQPALAAIGLAIASLIVARHGSPWIAAFAGLNLMIAVVLLVIARRKSTPPKRPPDRL